MTSFVSTCRQGLRGALAVHPRRIRGVDAEHFGWDRRDSPIATLNGALFNRNMIIEALAIRENKRVQINESADSICNAIRRAADDGATVGMSAEHCVRKFLPADQIHHV
jgi:hypothetical protein